MVGSVCNSFIRYDDEADRQASELCLSYAELSRPSYFLSDSIHSRHISEVVSLGT